MTSATAARPTEQRTADPAEGGRSGTWPGPRQLAALVAVLLAAYATLLMVRALRGILIVLLVSLFLGRGLYGLPASARLRGSRPHDYLGR